MQLITQCVCFCGLYLEKSLILTLKNLFILQWGSVPLSCFDCFPHVYSYGAGDGIQGLKQIKYVLHHEGSSPGLERLPCVSHLGTRLLNMCSFG